MALSNKSREYKVLLNNREFYVRSILHHAEKAREGNMSCQMAASRLSHIEEAFEKYTSVMDEIPECDDYDPNYLQTDSNDVEDAYYEAIASFKDILNGKNEAINSMNIETNALSSTLKTRANSECHKTATQSHAPASHDQAIDLKQASIAHQNSPATEIAKEREEEEEESHHIVKETCQSQYIAEETNNTIVEQSVSSHVESNDEKQKNSLHLFHTPEVCLSTHVDNIVENNSSRICESNDLTFATSPSPTHSQIRTHKIVSSEIALPSIALNSSNSSHPNRIMAWLQLNASRWKTSINQADVQSLAYNQHRKGLEETKKTVPDYVLAIEFCEEKTPWVKTKRSYQKETENNEFGRANYENLKFLQHVILVLQCLTHFYPWNRRRKKSTKHRWRRRTSETSLDRISKDLALGNLTATSEYQLSMLKLSFFSIKLLYLDI